MTVLLVLFTLILFLAADYVVQRRRTEKANARLLPLLPRDTGIPHDVRVAENHTWIKVDKQGDVVVGLDELLGKLVGPIEEIIFPSVNALIAPATSRIALRQGGKTLDVAIPVAGRIIEVNNNAQAHPAVTTRDPYGDGWLVRIRPSSPASEGYLTFGGEKARQWLRQQIELVKEFFLPRMPSARFATVQDGGIPADGLLEQFDAVVWKEFQSSFVALRHHLGTPGNTGSEVQP